MGALTLSCGASASGPGGPSGTGGNSTTGTGGGTPVGTGGTSAIGSGGTSSSGPGGAGPVGDGGMGPAGSAGHGTAGGGGAVVAQGTGGTGGAGNSSGDIWGGLKNPPRKSAGCDKPATITNGTKSIMSSGMARTFIVDIPSSYDPSKPYRLFYVSHGLGGSAQQVAGAFNFFGLKPQATAANDPAIFVAGQGLTNANGQATWGEVDHAFFDDVTAFVENGLCVDLTRVFVTGMSMGGMYTYSLSTDRQKSFRAGVGLAPTNFNIWLPNPTLTDPVAWMQTTGNVDTFCPWVSDEAQMKGSKFIAMEKATANGCQIPNPIPFWQAGAHLCYDFEGCRPGYPVKACSFMGPHTDNNRDPGSNVNWIAVESWKFFTQF